MKALVFAAGLGTRLKPFTLSHPKALAPVAGKPMLQRVVEKLRDQGVDEIVVNVHHFPDQIIDFMRRNDGFGLRWHISDERSLLLDTGGGLLAARQWLDGGEPFIIHNADILTDFDLRPMVEAHRRSGAVATLLASERKTSRMLLMDSNMDMRGWTNVNTAEVRPAGLDTAGLQPMAFGGVHVASPAIFEALAAYSPQGGAFPIMPFYIDACSHLHIHGYQQPAGSCWFDIGKPEALEAANAAFPANE